jgi:SAM-dependent methyltransferase
MLHKEMLHRASPARCAVARRTVRAGARTHGATRVARRRGHAHNAAVLDAIFIGSTTSAVTEALRSAGVRSGAVAVIGPQRLGRALGERGYEIVQVVDRPRPRPRGNAIARQVQAVPASLPLADGELAALVAGGAGSGDDWQTLLAEWSRVVRDGGVVVLVDRAPPAEMARRALCSGLTEIEQRRAGRKIVTSGCVAKL